MSQPLPTKMITNFHGFLSLAELLVLDLLIKFFKKKFRFDRDNWKVV